MGFCQSLISENGPRHREHKRFNRRKNLQPSLWFCRNSCKQSGTPRNLRGAISLATNVALVRSDTRVHHEVDFKRSGAGKPVTKCATYLKIAVWNRNRKILNQVLKLEETKFVTPRHKTSIIFTNSISQTETESSWHFRPDLRPHLTHWYGNTPVCFRTCRFSCVRDTQLNPQCAHLWTFFAPRGVVECALWREPLLFAPT